MRQKTNVNPYEMDLNSSYKLNKLTGSFFLHNFNNTDPVMGAEKNVFRLKFKTALNMVPQNQPFVGLAKLRLTSLQDVGVVGGEIDFIIYYNYDPADRSKQISSIKLVNNNSYTFMMADEVDNLKLNIDVGIDSSDFNIIDIYLMNDMHVSDRESPKCHMHKFEYYLEAISTLENTYTFGDSTTSNTFVSSIPQKLRDGNILIPGSMSPGFKYDANKPGLNYIKEVVKKEVAGFKSLEFVRFNEFGDSVLRSVNTKNEYGDEIIVKRGVRGYTGDTTGKPDKPEAPFNVPYGTIIDWPTGGQLADGWVYCSGGVIPKSRYPHMVNILKLSNLMNAPMFSYPDMIPMSYSSSTGPGGWNYAFINNKNYFGQDNRKNFEDGDLQGELNSEFSLASSQCYKNQLLVIPDGKSITMSFAIIWTNEPDKINYYSLLFWGHRSYQVVGVTKFIFRPLTYQTSSSQQPLFKDIQKYIGSVSMETKHLNANIKKLPNLYLYLGYFDEETKVAVREIRIPMKDFVVGQLGKSEFSSYSFESNRYRFQTSLYVFFGFELEDPAEVPADNFIHTNISFQYFSLDKETHDSLQIPLENDSSGNPRIIYIGQPVNNPQV